MLVIQSKRTDYNTKISEIKKKITDHDYDKYITNPEFNKLTADFDKFCWKITDHDPDKDITTTELISQHIIINQHKQIQQAKMIVLLQQKRKDLMIS